MQGESVDDGFSLSTSMSMRSPPDGGSTTPLRLSPTVAAVRARAPFGVRLPALLDELTDALAA